jgi:hypothetical protein
MVRLLGFVQRYGWRAYALPVLLVVTVVALTTSLGASHNPASQTGGVTTPGALAAPTTPASTAPTSTAPVSTAPSTAPSPESAPPAPTSSQLKVDAPGESEDLPADALPPGPAYTLRGAGTFRILPGSTAIAGSGGPVRHYVIEVENGVAGVDLAVYAALIDQTLDAPKGWTGGAHTLSLQRVSTYAQADFRIALTSSLTLRPPCGHSLNIETSCWDNQHGPSRVYLNVARWVRGDAQFGQDLAAYHLYMNNHEVGHALGHFHTYVCLPNGLAPVMMQQTITLKENQGTGPKICQPNAWPYPNGVLPRVAVPT